MNCNAAGIIPLALLPISENGAGPLAIMSENELHQTLQRHSHNCQYWGDK